MVHLLRQTQLVDVRVHSSLGVFVAQLSKRADALDSCWQVGALLLLSSRTTHERVWAGVFAVGRPRVCVVASHKHRRMHELLTAATCGGLNLVELRPQASRALLLSVALPRDGGKAAACCGVRPLMCIHVLTQIWTHVGVVAPPRI